MTPGAKALARIYYGGDTPLRAALLAVVEQSLVTRHASGERRPGTAAIAAYSELINISPIEWLTPNERKRVSRARALVEARP
jgi:hypothetical protein